jgi:2-polyprenyl-3-methyl-5-hydroxy-6-metoxy-1,4-benzoquinol methylase
MYLTKEQINEIINRIGQPRASVLLNKFFNSYRHKLSSLDVAELYDADYLSKIENHPVAIKVKDQFIINIYNFPSYSYICNTAKRGSILDIGCGVGNFLLALSTQGFSGVGVDFNESSINQANEKAKRNKLPISFLCQDATTISEDNLFDFIVMNDITEHVSDDELIKIFKKVKKLLKPNGKFLIHTPNGLALCHDTDTSLLQKIYKFYLFKIKKQKDFERTCDQIYYDQVHINIKSFKELNHILQSSGFKSIVNYEVDPVFNRFKFLNKIFKSVISSNMLVIAKHK